MIHKGFKMKLYEGMAEEYEKRHNELWPEMKDMIHEHGDMRRGRRTRVERIERTGRYGGKT